MSKKAKPSSVLRKKMFFPVAFARCRKCKRTITKKELDAKSHPCR